MTQSLEPFYQIRVYLGKELLHVSTIPPGKSADFMLISPMKFDRIELLYTDPKAPNADR